MVLVQGSFVTVLFVILPSNLDVDLCSVNKVTSNYCAIASIIDPSTFLHIIKSYCEEIVL